MCFLQSLHQLSFFYSLQLHNPSLNWSDSFVFSLYKRCSFQFPYCTCTRHAATMTESMVISGYTCKDRSNSPAGRGFSPSTQSILPLYCCPPAKKGWFSQKLQQVSMFEHQGSMGVTSEAPHRTTLRLRLNVKIPFDKNWPSKTETSPCVFKYVL